MRLYNLVASAMAIATERTPNAPQINETLFLSTTKKTTAIQIIGGISFSKRYVMDNQVGSPF
jgi:hypothetical protein